MASDEVVAPKEPSWPLSAVLITAGVGGGLELLSGILRLLPEKFVGLQSLLQANSGVATTWLILRIMLFVVGLILGGLAVWMRPRSPLVLLVGTCVALSSFFATEASWDSVQLFIRVLTAVAAVATLMVSLPYVTGYLNMIFRVSSGSSGKTMADLQQQGERIGRGINKFLISLLILYHFGGILAAVSSVPPSPWLVTYIWMNFYRPYLQFLYLNNAYHFYSPDPGPPCLLWFHIEYENGTSRWIKIPNREDHAKDPLAQEFYRRLALTESTNQQTPANAMPPPQVFQMRINVTQQQFEHGSIPVIPFHPNPDFTPNFQYREPQNNSKLVIKEYARWAAQAHPYDAKQVQGQPAVDGANQPVGVKRVKVYRVIHRLLHPHEFADGESPLDITTFLPFYQGTFDKDGKQIYPYDGIRDASQDPYLYWLIPIWKDEVPDNDAPVRPLLPGTKKNKQYKIHDYLEKHAGSPHWQEKPAAKPEEKP